MTASVFKGQLALCKKVEFFNKTTGKIASKLTLKGCSYFEY